jgi:hypothetical protein
VLSVYVSRHSLYRVQEHATIEKRKDCNCWVTACSDTSGVSSQSFQVRLSGVTVDFVVSDA